MERGVYPLNRGIPEISAFVQTNDSNGALPIVGISYGPAWMQEVEQRMEQLPSIWTLPPGDADFSIRWNLIKGHFSRAIPQGERISPSRNKRRERGLWQRRFRAHLLCDQVDFNNPLDYIHWNPVKHGRVQRVVDWPHSSFHRFVERGVYPVNWGHSGDFSIRVNE